MSDDAGGLLAPLAAGVVVGGGVIAVSRLRGSQSGSGASLATDGGAGTDADAETEDSDGFDPDRDREMVEVEVSDGTSFEVEKRRYEAHQDCLEHESKLCGGSHCPVAQEGYYSVATKRYHL